MRVEKKVAWQDSTSFFGEEHEKYFFVGCQDNQWLAATTQWVVQHVKANPCHQKNLWKLSWNSRKEHFDGKLFFLFSLKNENEREKEVNFQGVRSKRIDDSKGLNLSIIWLFNGSSASSPITPSWNFYEANLGSGFFSAPASSSALNNRRNDIYPKE